MLAASILKAQMFALSNNKQQHESIATINNIICGHCRYILEKEGSVGGAQMSHPVTFDIIDQRVYTAVHCIKYLIKERVRRRDRGYLCPLFPCPQLPRGMY